MPFKDPERKKEHNRIYFAQWYKNNKEKVLKSNSDYKKENVKTGLHLKVLWLVCIVTLAIQRS